MRSQPSFTEFGSRRQGRPTDLGMHRRGSDPLESLSRCSTARCLVVDAASVELRQALGPTSWMVLEELLLRSSGAADECVARVSVRAFAASLGLAKDTVARAIRLLRDAGIVTAAQQRTTAGAFDTGTYLLAVPDCIALSAPTRAATKPRPRVGQRNHSQLSLAIEP